MTEFKDGDKVRYRYVIEGEAEVGTILTSDGARQYITAGIQQFDDENPWLDDPHLTVELIYPLPTEPGSIIIANPTDPDSIRAHLLTDEGKWESAVSVRDSKAMWEYCQKTPHRIIPAPIEHEVAG